MVSGICVPMAWAQTSQDIIGKHRIQYDEFDWQYLSSPNFDVYYYGKADLAKSAAQHAELEFEDITDLLGFSPYAKIQLYIYESKSDLRQSNVGLNEENNLIGGHTSFSKSIIEIPFPGNQVQFRYEIRQSMARTLLYEMMYGGSFKESVQNAILLNLPDWYLGGAALYAAYGWDQNMDDYMRDQVIYHPNYLKPNTLAGEEAVLAGQSIWAFIVKRYGRSSFSNILNLTRIMRNEENSISTTLGVSYERIIRDWRASYRMQAEQTLEGNRFPKMDTRLPLRRRRNDVFNNIRISPDGKQLAWSLNDEGKYRLFVKNLETGRTRRVKSAGQKVLAQRFDANVPLICFGGNELLYGVIIRRGVPELLIYDLASKRKSYRILQDINQVNCITASPDGKVLALSADKNGKTDLYLYYPNSQRFVQITNDLADDVEPCFSADGKRLVFASNRIKDSLQARYEHKDITDQFDIFEIAVNAKPKDSLVLKRLTDSPFSCRKPRIQPNGRISYLANDNGIWNIKILDTLTRKTHCLTDYAMDLQDYDLHGASGTLTYVAWSAGRQQAFLRQGMDISATVVPLPTERARLFNPEILQKKGLYDYQADSLARAKVRLEADSLYIKRVDSLNSGLVNIRYYIFDSEKSNKQLIAPVPDEKLPQVLNSNSLNSSASIGGLIGLVKYPLKNLLGPFPYRNRLSFNSTNSSLVIDPLQGYGTFIDATLTDMFENHRFNAGGILFLDLRSSWYNLEYAYLKKRVDFKIRYNRRSYYYSSENSNSVARYLLGRLEATASYPLGFASAISVSGFYSQTRYRRIFENNVAGVAAPDIVHPYVGLKLEYNFDNTVSKGLNLIEGTRVKIKTESHFSSESSQRNFDQLLVDVRRYQPIHREIVLAIRGSYGSFSGPAAKQYMLGGMDNWLFNNTNSSSQTNDPFGPRANRGPEGNDGLTDRLFNPYVTNLRGFRYNTLFGNHYMLFNAELRMPIVRYLYKGPIESNFLKHFQLIAFYDMGTAWSGGNPFSTNNSINTRTVGGGANESFLITVTNFSDPFLRSYGAGFRTMMLGYYVKLDVAQGFQNGVRLSPFAHVTLGSDF